MPVALEGRDIIALAATGSGKTLAYLLPLIIFAHLRFPGQSVPMDAHARGVVPAPWALIVVPTRELMEQVFHVAALFAVAEDNGVEEPTYDESFAVNGRHFAVRGICGGVSIFAQLQMLRSHDSVDPSSIIVIATPGRLLHFVEKGFMTLAALRYLVLDEVDRMLDSEMEPQLRRILRMSNTHGRQTLLWSATMPHFLERLARSAVLDPVTIHVGMGQGKEGIASTRVAQQIVVLHANEKRSKLLQVLRTIPFPPVLVFCNAHETVDAVTRMLRHEQFHVAALHGDKPQSYRFQVMAAFRDGFVDVLVATDLAARGLDFTSVHSVVLYDMPQSIQDYIHRVGRTGRRSGHDDRVVAFVTRECSITSELVELLQESKQSVPPELLRIKRLQQRETDADGQ